MIFFKLFYVFLKIGFFSFGGGLAMLPMVQKEVYKYGWLSESEFLNIISISQVTPGAISINTATFVGLKMGGILGALSATLGIVVPSLVTILLIALVYEKIKNNPYKEAFFRGVKPVT
ncbi:MAG: chromate transporter, partial [Fusobacteriaceae bacterium]